MPQGTFPLQELLLRRKELQQRLAGLKTLKDKDLFEIKVKRINVTESVDEVTAAVPKLSIENVTAAHDYCAKQLRLVDAAIQKTNWTTQVEVDAIVMEDFKTPSTDA